MHWENVVCSADSGVGHLKKVRTPPDATMSGSSCADDVGTSYTSSLYSYQRGRDASARGSGPNSLRAGLQVMKCSRVREKNICGRREWRTLQLKGTKQDGSAKN